MKNKSVRLALVSVVAVLSVFGLSQSPADASSGSRGTLCCR
jgi:hypothetical protein